jgi:hypothetical protein
VHESFLLQRAWRISPDVFKCCTYNAALIMKAKSAKLYTAATIGMSR